QFFVFKNTFLLKIDRSRTLGSIVLLLLRAIAREVISVSLPSLPPAPPDYPSHSRRLVEAAFLASTSALIWLTTVYINPTGPFLRLFFSMPVALAVVRWGRRTGNITLAVTTLLLTVLMGPTRSVVYFMPYGCLGLWLGRLWRSRRSWYWSIPTGAALNTFGLIFQFALSSLLVGENLWRYLILQLTTLTNWLLDWTLGWLGIYISASTWGVTVTAIAMLAAHSLLYVFFVHVIAYLVLEKLGSPISEPPRWVKPLME
ncbi:MAG: DUF2232 domain-containing protein, partial [Cyanobacteria bacterium J06648_11]